MANDPTNIRWLRTRFHSAHEHPDPLGPVRDLHLEHLLDGQRDAQLVVEGRQPVVAVGERHDLAVVAVLGELLEAAVHVADDGAGRR
jgi:hypothetical protein